MDSPFHEGASVTMDSPFHESAGRSRPNRIGNPLGLNRFGKPLGNNRIGKPLDNTRKSIGADER